MPATKPSRDVRFAQLEEDVRLLKKQFQQLALSPALSIAVTTLAPEPFDLIQPVPVAIQRMDDEYVASFFDANVNASGSTETDAVANLKDVMLSIFEQLSDLPEKKLGPGPRRQLAVLREFIRKRR